MEFKDRLKLARKLRKVGQVTLAEAVGLDQTTISNLETGKVRSTSKAVEIASYLRINAAWLATGKGEMELTGPSHDNSPHESDYALIPLLTAKGENGNGYLNDHVEVKGGLAFKRDWLARMNAKPEDLSVIYARGDSMEPYIIEGDVVLIDHAATDPINGKVYAIRRPDDSISIKRLVQQLSGDWIITSDNPNKTLYRDEPVGADSVCQVPIIGRVVWRGGALS